MSKGAKSLRLAEWPPWPSWPPWFGHLAKKVLSKLLLLVKGAKVANEIGHARAREIAITEAGSGNSLVSITINGRGNRTMEKPPQKPNPDSFAPA
jgi:hypothetical protein